MLGVFMRVRWPGVNPCAKALSGWPCRLPGAQGFSGGAAKGAGKWRKLWDVRE